MIVEQTVQYKCQLNCYYVFFQIKWYLFLRLQLLKICLHGELTNITKQLPLMPVPNSKGRPT